jgi:hypothetical protein
LQGARTQIKEIIAKTHCNVSLPARLPAEAIAAVAALPASLLLPLPVTPQCPCPCHLHALS